jgi:hypothetical protein
VILGNDASGGDAGRRRDLPLGLLRLDEHQEKAKSHIDWSFSNLAFLNLTTRSTARETSARKALQDCAASV